MKKNLQTTKYDEPFMPFCRSVSEAVDVLYDFWANARIKGEEFKKKQEEKKYESK